MFKVSEFKPAPYKIYGTIPSPVVKYKNEFIIAAPHRNASQWFTHVIKSIDESKKHNIKLLDAAYLDTPERQLLINYNLTDLQTKPVYLSTRRPLHQYQSALTIPMFYWNEILEDLIVTNKSNSTDSIIAYCLGVIQTEITMACHRIFVPFDDIPYPYLDIDLGIRDRFRPAVYSHLYMSACGIDVRPISIEDSSFTDMVGNYFEELQIDLTGKYNPFTDPVKTNQVRTNKTNYATSSELGAAVFDKLVDWFKVNTRNASEYQIKIFDALDYADKVYKEFSLVAATRSKEENKEHAIHLIRELFTDENFKLSYGSELVNFKFFCQYVPELDSIKRNLNLDDLLKTHGNTYWSTGENPQLYLIEDIIKDHSKLDNSNAWC